MVDGPSLRILHRLTAEWQTFPHDERGYVRQVLATLVSLGLAERAPGFPYRYRLTEAGAQALAAQEAS